MRSGLRSLACEKMFPGRAIEALGRADGHDLVIGRMKLHAVDAPPLRIEAQKLGRMRVGTAAQLGRCGASGNAPKHFEIGGRPSSALPLDHGPQPPVRREQIHIDEGRTLIEGGIVPRRIGHDLTLPKLRYGELTLNAPACLMRGSDGLIQCPLMSIAAQAPTASFSHRHLLGIEGLSRGEIIALLDLSEEAAKLGRQVDKKRDDLRGRTLINLFFEASTRTQSSFELAGKRLGADVMNMSIPTSSIKKGETLIDTAVTLNAMRPDLLVVRHHAAGAVELLSQKVDCSVINAGDGSHEHPTQALLDALTIRRHKNRIEGLTVAICGDIMHSRVARSNILLLNTLGAHVRVVAPSTLLGAGVDRLGVEVYTSMPEGLQDADIVMMLRLQRERMAASLIPSQREYFHFYGLDYDKLARAKPDALIMHPGPMNRGVEIDSNVADDARSVIREQVEMGVAVRIAVLQALARHLPNQ